MPIAVNTERITAAPRRPALEKILGDGLSTSSSSDASFRTSGSRITSGWPRLYKRYVDSYYRFIFVGRYDGLPRYYAQVRALIAEFHMLPDRFWFTGPVPDEDLGAFYRWAGRLRLAERARRLLRAAARGDGRRRAGSRLRGRRGARDAGRRRRAVPPEGPGIRGRNCWACSCTTGRFANGHRWTAAPAAPISVDRPGAIDG